ncbi:MAG: hypothetical protein ACI8WT_004642 [Clostridium sp.]|jgi:hypothetical protein
MVEKKNTKKYSFDELKLYYESTEKVTARRHETNRWNYSICIATLVAIAYILNWVIKNSKFVFISIICVTILAIMAVLFTSLWINQIKDFKSLNNAKFEIINEVSSNIIFTNISFNNITTNITTNISSEAKSFEPFKKEWDKLKELEALQKNSNNHIIALKSSNIEYFIPKCIRIIFILIAIISNVVIIYNFKLFIKEFINIINLS